ncbi:hypothetical protein P43SY_002527 [Pythium insidiosum]|uniref:Uncharacterized protein n=1 Tax=Pythium insidiosum TaxID=114742 RepID=A0AAD5MA20_PYTIN|nr:hypothetical protein P43SY_002527 [Pythium insidiosum]
MPTSHLSAHELDLLESYVHDCVQQLPRLPTARPHELPSRCAAYHTACSGTLQHVLAVLATLSPRFCQLVAQIWELTSLNVFVLLQLAQSTLEERDALHTKWRHMEQFYESAVAQHAQRAQQFDAELERCRLQSRELRAELKKTRQKLNRLGLEHNQVRKALHNLMEMHETVAGRSVHELVEKNDLATAAVASATASLADEWELFGVAPDQLDQVEKVHPLESNAEDLDQLFQGLFDKEREQVALLNEMDRFINSNVVALLWRHGPEGEQSRFLQQIMNAKTIGTQTEDLPTDLLDDDEFGDWASADNEDGQELVAGETGAATVVTKRQVIPASLRAQLTTRPKIQRVLEKDQLSRAVLCLLLEKMETDGSLLRKQQPRVALHRFMKDFFLARYGIAPLADYHMMELVKSCHYYLERFELETRQPRTATVAVPSAATSNMALPALQIVGIPDGCSVGTTADTRIQLFSRLCELVPLQWRDGATPSVGGNLFANAVNATVDLLGDVIELDASVSNLRDVVQRGGNAVDGEWTCPLDTAAVLLRHHLSFLDQSAVAEITRQLQTPSAVIAVDVVLLVFAAHWLDNDQRLTARLHDAFHRHVASLNSSSVSFDDAAARLAAAPPLEQLKHIWKSLQLSVLEMDELSTAFVAILDLRQAMPSALVRGRSSHHASFSGAMMGKRYSAQGRRGSAAMGSLVPLIGGINEKEFVFHSMQVLRGRRGTKGMRTNGRSVEDVDGGRHLGPRGSVLAQASLQLPAEDLKPGF